MDSKDNNNEMLSFEQLREQLGMTEPAKDETPTEKENSIDGDIVDKINESLDKELSDESEKPQEKIIVENGKTFIDITEQYVTKNEDVSDEPKSDEPKPEPKKKKVRTFNEIFSAFFKDVFPNKQDSKKEVIRKIIMDISIVTIIGCLIAFGELYRERKQELSLEGELKGQIVDVDSMNENQVNSAWQEVFAQYPAMTFPEGMNLKYAYLYALNQDLVGWITIDNTNLDVQVVKSDDNNYYLRRNFYEEPSRYGCPYMDYRNNSRYLDDNTVIYGHHMSDGLMFSNLDKYKTLEGYIESPIIQFETLYETYQFKVFAAFITNAEADEDNGYIFNFTVTEFYTDSRFEEFIEEVQKRSIINTGVSVQPDDKILTLVTCSHEFDEARLVVMGRLVRSNEDATVNTEEASLNTSPKYPQAWYDVKGMDNPYKDDEKWS